MSVPDRMRELCCSQFDEINPNQITVVFVSYHFVSLLNFEMRHSYNEALT